LVILGILELLHPLDLVAGFALAVCLLAVWAVSATIGYVVSTLFKDMKTIWPYSALLTNLFGILPPVFYPFSRVPIEWRSVVLIVPTSAAAILVNAAAGLESVTQREATIAAAALGLEAVSLFVFGIYWARRMARER
jgi:ABC-type polysaccharide/polyol phosphate export permease